MSLLFVIGCSLYQVQERRLTHRFEAHRLESTTVEREGTTLRYWRGGDGPPVVLLHGFGGDGLFTWHGQLELAGDHALYVPDLVWFGGSRSTRADYGLDLQVDAVLALLDAEGIEHATVVGVSYGGLVAWSLLAAAPERVDRLVIVDSPGPVWTAADHAEMLARFGVAEPADIVVPTGPDGVRRLLELGYHDPPATPKFLLTDVYRHMFSDAVDEKRKLLAALESEQAALTSADWSVDVATLLVWGEHDPLFPVSVGERLRDAIGPRAELVVLPATAHAPNVEDPEGFNAALQAFLAAR